MSRQTTQPQPGPGRSTSEAAFGDEKKLIAERNEKVHRAARTERDLRERKLTEKRRRAENR